VTPQHDEIIKHLDDGFTVAWDTTRRDPATIRAVRKVARAQSALLGEIFRNVGVAGFHHEDVGIAESPPARRSPTPADDPPQPADRPGGR